MADGNRPRTPGMPVMGMEKMGPLGPRVVKPETKEALEAIAAQTLANPKPAEEEELPPLPDPKTPEPKPEAEPESKKAEQILPDAGPMAELNRLEAMGAIRDPKFHKRMAFLDCPERREIIESRCKPLDFNEYVLTGEWRQIVPIWGESRPTVEFRSTDTDDEIIIRLYLSGEYSTGLVSDVAQALLTITAGLVRFGDQRLTEFPPADADFNARKDIFAKRLKEVKKLCRSWIVMFDIYINYLWFGGRIREAMFGADAPF